MRFAPTLELFMLATWLGFFEGFLIILFTLVSVIMILVVLIQKGRGGGLAGAFGGGGGSTAFGSKTGDVLTWATSIIFGIFLLLAITLNLLTRYETSGNVQPSPVVPIQNSTPSAPARPAPSAPAAAPAGPAATQSH
jgi:preprotein translocase subunit SecG